MSKKEGYRGYVGSRPYSGLDFPQQIQNFLIRNYCQKNQLHYLLSATEYRMPGCYMILEEVMDAIEMVEGVVLFSIFMLPTSVQKRQMIYDRILNASATLHAALEEMVIRTKEDVQAVEDMLRLNKIALTDQSMAFVREFVMPEISKTAVSF